MSRAQAESVIKNIIREIAQECAGKGHAVSETLVAFMVKAVVLDPANEFNVDRTLTKDDVQKLIRLCVDRVMDNRAPSLDTVKMQVYFDMNYTTRHDFLEEHRRVLESRLQPVIREITDSRARTREELESLYRKIVSAVLLRSGLGSPTDIGVVREATAALQSVFPQTELGTFMALTKRDKERQLLELTLIVTGIRLFNKECGKGGEGIDDRTLDDSRRKAPSVAGSTGDTSATLGGVTEPLPGPQIQMPRIWTEYCLFLIGQALITRTRRVFDRALRSLPITQHNRIWPLYLKFTRTYDIPETTVRLYRRYLKLCKENTEDYIEYLTGLGKLDEAAERLVDIINDEKFVSKEGKSKHQLWSELCDLVAKNPDKVTSLKVEPIIRQGLKRYSDQVGVLWNAMADYYIRYGLFERARDIYEEAIQTVITVRDFTQVYDAYAQFEKSMTTARMETVADLGATEEDELDLDIRIARLEHLVERRRLLLNRVLLRQNPHNVFEWHKRVQLYEGQTKEIVATYNEAINTVDPKLATGKPHTLWVEFAKCYETAGQVEDARLVFDKSTKVPYKAVDDLASVCCEWAEMEIRHENFERALDLMKRFTTPPPRKVAYHDETETVQNRVHRSLKIWSFYADLEESLGTFKTCKAVYDHIIELRIATPQIIFNYALFLEENNYFEEAFKVYEKGIALFKWPNVYDIWNTYLTKFIERYGGTKLERVRDLFEQCLDGCPPKFAKSIFLLYAKLEEEHGLARHAMSVYERSTMAVLPEEQYEMFNVYIKQAAEIYGVTHTRSIYEKAIEVLHEEQAREMCVRFADLERKLGEIDRARAVYAHCSQICDPRVAPSFWKTWKEFEIKHGNEDTVREMLRIKRSVQATYNTQVNFMAGQMLAAQGAKADDKEEAAPDNEMKRLEDRARQLAEEAVKDTAKPDKGILFVRSNVTDDELGDLTRTANPEEIDIDEDYSTDEDEEIEEVEQQSVPTQVFGTLAPEDD